MFKILMFWFVFFEGITNCDNKITIYDNCLKISFVMVHDNVYAHGSFFLEHKVPGKEVSKSFFICNNNLIKCGLNYN